MTSTTKRMLAEDLQRARARACSAHGRQQNKEIIGVMHVLSALETAIYCKALPDLGELCQTWLKSKLTVDEEITESEPASTPSDAAA